MSDQVLVSRDALEAIACRVAEGECGEAIGGELLELATALTAPAPAEAWLESAAEQESDGRMADAYRDAARNLRELRTLYSRPEISLEEYIALEGPKWAGVDAVKFVREMRGDHGDEAVAERDRLREASHVVIQQGIKAGYVNDYGQPKLDSPLGDAVHELWRAVTNSPALTAPAPAERQAQEEIAALRTEHDELRKAGGYRDPQSRRLMDKLGELIDALERQAQATQEVAWLRERIQWSREALKARDRSAALKSEAIP